MSASLKINLNALRPTQDVWFDDVAIKNVTSAIKFSPKEESILEKEYSDASALLESIKKFANEVSTNPIRNQIKQLENSYVKTGKQLSEEDFKQIVLYVESQYKSETKRKEVVSFLKDNKLKFFALLKFRQIIISLKLQLLNKLNTISGLGTFIERCV